MGEQGRGSVEDSRGEVRTGENNFVAVKREFEEELGFLPHDEFLALGTLTQNAAGAATLHASTLPACLQELGLERNQCRSPSYFSAEAGDMELVNNATRS
jgi:predicted NUDIX family NTP pyrophosphohydrolase